jgi:putative alpha-1,2-mannosidase
MHSTILRGGELTLTMGPAPNKTKGTDSSDFPYSFSTDKSNPLNNHEH